MRNLLVSAVLPVLLCACGGKGAGDQSPVAAAAESVDESTYTAVTNVISVPDTVRYQAVFYQSNVGLGEEGDVSVMVAVFTEFPNMALTDLLKKAHESELGCKVKRQTIEEMATEQALLNAQYPLAILSNAGEAITVDTPTGTWPPLKSVGSTGASYAANWDAELGLLPAGSSLQVPGNEFPAISKVELPFAESLTGVKFLNESMEPLLVIDKTTPNVVVKWDAPASSTSKMKLSLLNKKFDDTGTLESVSSTVCTIADNGTFTIPNEIKLMMDKEYAIRSLVRVNDISEKMGDTLVYARSESRSVAAE